MANFNTRGVSPDSMKAGSGGVLQYRAVALDSTEGQVVATSAITDIAYGASMTSGSAGDQILIQRYGKAKLTASAAISIGAQVMPTASGSGKVMTAAGATAKSLGVALQAAGADGDIIEVELATPNVNGPANA